MPIPAARAAATATATALTVALALSACATHPASAPSSPPAAVARAARHAPAVGPEDETPAGAFQLDDVAEGLHFAGTADICVVPDEGSVITSITGEGGRLDVEAAAGGGSIGLVGDAVFTGTIDQVQVGDAGDVVIRGTDASPLAEGYGSTFTITGRCPAA